MSRVPKSSILYRIGKALVFFEEPHTIKELAEHIGMSHCCAYGYIKMFRDNGYPLEERKMVIPKGRPSREYWINYKGEIVLEALRMLARLKGM